MVSSDYVINAIFLGPPGSGKGTQARLISDRYHIANISASEVLRHNFLYNNSVCKLSTFDTINLMNSGKLIDDKLIIKLIINHINKNNFKNGFILDGFPRTIIQAKSLYQNNIFINFIIEFNIEWSEIINRIVDRQIHTASGRIYHKKFNPPKRFGIDDVTGEKLITRKDDNKNTILKRLNQYYKYTSLLIQYYQKKNNINYFVINGNQSITAIYQEIIDIFSNFIKN